MPAPNVRLEWLIPVALLSLMFRRPISGTERAFYFKGLQLQQKRTALAN